MHYFCCTKSGKNIQNKYQIFLHEKKTDGFSLKSETQSMGGGGGGGGAWHMSILRNANVACLCCLFFPVLHVRKANVACD